MHFGILGNPDSWYVSDLMRAAAARNVRCERIDYRQLCGGVLQTGPTIVAGELDLHEAPHADDPVHQHSWKEYAGWAVGGLAALAVVVLGGRRLMTARQPQAGGAA